MRPVKRVLGGEHTVFNRWASEVNCKMKWGSYEHYASSCIWRKPDILTQNRSDFKRRVLLHCWASIKLRNLNKKFTVFHICIFESSWQFSTGWNEVKKFCPWPSYKAICRCASQYPLSMMVTELRNIEEERTQRKWSESLKSAEVRSHFPRR